MSIKGLKLVAYEHNDCETFMFNDSIETVKNKLEKADFSTKVYEMNGLTVMENNQNYVLLVFDKENKLCGIVNNEVDGSDQEEIGVAFISENNTIDNFTVGEFCNNFTDDVIDLEEYYEEANDPDMTPLTGYLNYCYDLILGEDSYVVQCTETCNTTEILSIIRKDLMDKTGIVFKTTIGDKEYNSVNTIDIIKNINNK